MEDLNWYEVLVLIPSTGSYYVWEVQHSSECEAGKYVYEAAKEYYNEVMPLVHYVYPKGAPKDLQYRLIVDGAA